MGQWLLVWPPFHRCEVATASKETVAQKDHFSKINPTGDHGGLFFESSLAPIVSSWCCFSHCVGSSSAAPLKRALSFFLLKHFSPLEPGPELQLYLHLSLRLTPKFRSYSVGTAVPSLLFGFTARASSHHPSRGRLILLFLFVP